MLALIIDYSFILFIYYLYVKLLFEKKYNKNILRKSEVMS